MQKDKKINGGLWKGVGEVKEKEKKTKERNVAESLYLKLEMERLGRFT